MRPRRITRKRKSSEDNDVEAEVLAEVEEEQQQLDPTMETVEEAAQAVEEAMPNIDTAAAATEQDAKPAASDPSATTAPTDKDVSADVRAQLDASISRLVTQGLWDDNATTVEAALTEVANLSFGHAQAGPNRVTISLTGGLLAIVKALTKHASSADVQAAGGRALQNLALDQNNKGGIASAGGIEVLVQAMQTFPQDASVQMGGCGTFQNLVWGNDENRLRILKAGGIPAIISAMKDHVDVSEMQEWACGALYLLSIGEQEVKEAILDAGGLSAISAAIEHHRLDGGIREKGRNALARLLW